MVVKSSETILFTVCLIGFGLIHVTDQSGIFGAPQALYGPNDHVVILNTTNIKSTIYGTKNAWNVEFYSSWCGHCINFAPVFKNFALEVESWQSVAKVAAIDCADETNIPTCRDYEIMGYPTMLFFPPNSLETKKTEDGKDELNRGEAFPRSDKVSALKHDLMEMVTPHFPGILSQVGQSATTFSSLWSHVKSTIPIGNPIPSLILILYENEKSFSGKELALRLSSFPEIRVVRFNKRNSLYDKLGFKDDWPAAAYLKPDLSSEIVVIPKNKDITSFLQSAVLKMLKIDHATSSKPGAPANQIAIAENPVEKEENILEEPAAHNNHDDVVSLEDLLHGIRNSLRNEVGMLKTISGSKLKVLKEYVHILGQLFPADRREMVVFLMKLDTWLNAQNGEIQINTYLDKLTELEIDLHPWDIDINTWGTCKGTLPGRREYTCSLWRLFHTLTILATQKSQEINVLPVVHGYVKEFFGCSECVAHFTKMVEDEGALTISSIRSQALWLWRAHNKVNTRLKGSASEDPGFPKTIYPTDKQCSGCYTSDGGFDEVKVFEFLINVYTNPVRTMQTHHESKRSNVVDGQSSHHEPQHSGASSKFFSGTDYWIFCIVYISVAALLIFGYVHFKLGMRRIRLDPFAICRKFIHTSKSIV